MNVNMNQPTDPIRPFCATCAGTGRTRMWKWIVLGETEDASGVPFTDMCYDVACPTCIAAGRIENDLNPHLRA